jgi:hypothetical protein
VQALKIVRVAVAARLGPLLALHRLTPKPLDGPGIFLPLGKAGRDRSAVLDGRLKSEPLCLLDLAQLQKRSQSNRVQDAAPDRTMRHQPRRFVVDLRVVPAEPEALIAAVRPRFLP